MRRARHLLEYVIVQTVALIVQILPLDVVRTVGAQLGEVFYRAGYRRKVTLDNLRHAFPDLPDTSLRSFALNAYRSFGVTFFEILWLPQATQRSTETIVHCENTDELRKIAGEGKGVLLLTAHFGNWEMLAHSLRFVFGKPIGVVAKEQANPYVDAAINRRRELCENYVITMNKAVREVLRALKSGGIVGMLADQTAAKESIAVPFFGREVPTYQGPALFALRTRAPLLLGFAVRQPDGTYRTRFDRVPMEDLPDASPENVLELTRRHVALTERAIRQHPEQWMWMHRRWKHVPSLSTGVIP